MVTIHSIIFIPALAHESPDNWRSETVHPRIAYICTRVSATEREGEQSETPSWST